MLIDLRRITLLFSILVSSFISAQAAEEFKAIGFLKANSFDLKTMVNDIEDRQTIVHLDLFENDLKTKIGHLYITSFRDKHHLELYVKKPLIVSRNQF